MIDPTPICVISAMMQRLVGDSGESLIVIPPAPFLTSQIPEQLPSHHQRKKLAFKHPIPQQ